MIHQLNAAEQMSNIHTLTRHNLKSLLLQRAILTHAQRVQTTHQQLNVAALEAQEDIPLKAVIQLEVGQEATPIRVQDLDHMEHAIHLSVFKYDYRQSTCFSLDDSMKILTNSKVCY